MDGRDGRDGRGGRAGGAVAAELGAGHRAGTAGNALARIRECI